jgi:hypothetical protein
MLLQELQELIKVVAVCLQSVPREPAFYHKVAEKGIYHSFHEPSPNTLDDIILSCPV